MLANNSDTPAQFGTLGRDVHMPATFGHELLDFISGELPSWRDRPDRPKETSETILTSQLCAHLNSVARHSAGWDILQFRVEEADEQYKGRKIDLVAAPCGATICIEGRRHTEFESLMPIECKRLPTPAGKDRDEREYVISQYSSTGGIQRFKAGHHGANHKLGAMIGYVQDETTTVWDGRVAGWITALAGDQPGWTMKDLLRLERTDASMRLAVFRSTHERMNGLPEIELRHFWVEMN
jgi:hypothetical protein